MPSSDVSQLSLERKVLAPFDPAPRKGFVEGNAPQYTWMTPYDFPGVIAALGGDAADNARLDAYFSEYGRFNGGTYFLISNEPSFSNPWIYKWSGEPWRTQVLVTRILHDLFLRVAHASPEATYDHNDGSKNSLAAWRSGLR